MWCEQCIYPEDLFDISAKKFHVAALGFVFDARPDVEEVALLPRSKLHRYKTGNYEYRVVEETALPQSFSKPKRYAALAEMARKYGKVAVVDEKYPLLTHRQRVETARQIAKNITAFEFNVGAVYLTGSTAINAEKDDGDIDLLVVLDRCPGTDKAHLDEVRYADGSRCPVDFFYMRREDFELARGFKPPIFKDNVLLAAKQNGAVATA